MTRSRLVVCLSITLSLVVPLAVAQQTVARLSHVDVSHVSSPLKEHPSAPLRDSSTSRNAADALFVRSDISRALALSERALRRNPQDAEALFVRMELAGIEADSPTQLEMALRLCEAGTSASGDLRVRLAAKRLREAAANTPEFRKAIPHIEAVLSNSQDDWPELQAALLSAAMDGASGPDAYAVARASGILTDWRVLGPLGLNPALNSNAQLISPDEDLSQDAYFNRAVENFQFPDGWIRLPDYMARRGSFFAAARFSSLNAEPWKIRLEGAGVVQLYVDGSLAVRTDSASRLATATIQVAPGPHRVLAQLTAAAAPFRVTVAPVRDVAHPPLRARLSLEEATYLLAAEHYVDGEPMAAIRQIDAVEDPATSVALQFLRAQSWSASAPASAKAAEAWSRMQQSWPHASAATVALALQAVAGHDFVAARRYAAEVLGRKPYNIAALEILTDPQVAASPTGELWTRRLAVHPSCQALLGAMHFYSSAGLTPARNATQHKLEGCAPQSLAYAQSLSSDGQHADAASALETLLAAAPLDRPARVMFVRELQMAGDDAQAQQAAAEWLHIAPNAENYHRLAAAASPIAQEPTESEFYTPYRRVAQGIHDATNADPSSPGAIVLLDDHVALARADGSVSLYVHTARQLLGDQVVGSGLARIPQGAQVLNLRALHPDGTTTELNRDGQQAANIALAAGDVVDSEYVLNFAGDGGIPEHAEAFQYVFGNFDEPVVNARFVVLTPADHADGGVIIATGNAPPLTSQVRDGMLERMWEKQRLPGHIAAGQGLGDGMAIIRVVEQENGWSVPSNAERQRRIETIHPGPRSEDS